MRRTPGKTTAAKEKYWEKIIMAARRYPQGVTEDCRVMNVSKNTYYFWFKRLRPKHPDWHDLTNHPKIVSESPASTNRQQADQMKNARLDTEVTALCAYDE